MSRSKHHTLIEYTADSHERGLLAFVASETQAHRMSYFLEKGERRRQDFLNLFWHDLTLDDCAKFYVASISPEEILTMLRTRGAPDICYVMSNYKGLDSKFLPLDDALNECADATYISCIPGKLGYFCYEAPSGEYLLERQPI